MSEGKKGSNTESVVWKLAKPIAEGLGLSVWDVRYVREGGNWFLRIFIDKPGGVGIDDCEAMSRAVNGPLDELDPIRESYCMEVSSPGLNRALTREEHFRAFGGACVAVRLIRPLEDGRRVLRGSLEGFEGGVLTLGLESGEKAEIRLKDSAWVKLLEDDELEEIEES